MSIEKMDNVNNMPKVNEVPGDGNKGKKFDGIIKWGCRGAIALLLWTAWYLKYENSQLQQNVDYRKSAAIENFDMYDSVCCVNDYAWYQLDQEWRTDFESLANSEEWSMEKYQNLLKNHEKNLIGDVQSFVQAIKDNFDINAEKITYESWDVWYEVKIWDKTEESGFEYNGKRYGCSIDTTNNTITCKVTDLATWTDLGTVSYHVWQWYWVTAPNVSAGEICLDSGNYVEKIVFDDKEKVIDKNVYDYENEKTYYMTGATFALHDMRDGRIRVFEYTTGKPLEWTYEVAIDTGDSMEWKYVNWFAEWPVVGKFDGGNTLCEVDFFRGRPFWRWIAGYNTGRLTEDWEAEFSRESTLFPWRIWDVLKFDNPEFDE